METLVLSALEKEGWHLQEQALRGIVEQIVGGEGGDGGSGLRNLDGDVRMELLDTDIKHFGAKSLPDAQSLLQLRVLKGLRVLQISSVSDISKSSRKALAGGNQQSRLLRFKLTDGHATVTAVEYRPIPSVSEDLPPGTKVVLGSTVSVHTGVFLLDVHCIRVLGGHVQVLYDAWEMDRKYSGVAREAGSKSLADGVSGPPPFRTFQGGKASRAGPGSMAQVMKPANSSRPISANPPPSVSGQERTHLLEGASTAVGKEILSTKAKPAVRPGAEPYRPRSGAAAGGSTISSVNQTNLPSGPEGTGVRLGTEGRPNMDMQSAEETRAAPAEDAPVLPARGMVSETSDSSAEKPDDRLKQIDQNIKEVLSLGIDAAPLQNQKAAQKLLEKSVDTDSRWGGRGAAVIRGRGGRRGRREGRDEEDEAVMTLDEWEARKNASKSLNTADRLVRPAGQSVDDEELARRLHKQINFESSETESSRGINAAEQLRMSMFNFAGNTPGGDDDARSRGRGRGRGQGRGRGRRHN